ncbi:hypothetical protein SK3146_00943 [Paenibacillus konkukensis]|uniref:Type III effector n=1 Tax=Paenibacillus konkukensis TaxID=2020716 RepID=A0ABY4RKF5_9BACL|nr:four-carbon acid sugar kinase family protein [Paenibacillus konkukensis]UQZ81787.1 hypothetical protein SK3146_00943 [Paenibacillus konkukensis]
MRICYYGDDFTGSTDVLEALTRGGLRVILFMEVPDKALWDAKFAGYDGFGVAGVSRTMRPDEMERALPEVFKALRVFGAPITHYKVCSTFDSSPETGSIGKVIELAQKHFPDRPYIPVVAGSPVLGRYTVFGNHFAAVGDHAVRLDRHPNLRKHPITSMNEADLQLHLARQTELTIELMDIISLEQEGELLEEAYRKLLAKQPDIVLFDVLNERHLRSIGALLTRESGKTRLFAVGSSGVEYALVTHWQSTGELPSEYLMAPADAVDRLLVISGSCSPVTQAQIEWALAHGFTGIKVPAELCMAEDDEASEALVPFLEQASRLLGVGHSVILYTALGPEDDAIERTQAMLRERGRSTAASGELIGRRLGALARELILHTKVRRLVLAGGDTSGFAASQLNLYALEMIAPVVPGGPLCRAYSEDERLDGLEVVLKGGQVGPPDFFERVRTGG